MHYLSYISFAFLLFQFTNVLINYLFSQKIGRALSSRKQLVSLLIPARNEEKNMGTLLGHLQALENSNIEIIVCDDQSSDQTARIVQQYAQSDARIKLIQSKDLPRDWLGKNHACYQLAQHAQGHYYLFLDADVQLYGTVVQDCVAYAQSFHLGLLSIFPHQILQTKGEKITVPVMNYILLTLLPLIFVRLSPFAAHSAANGQFMLFEADTYQRFQPHERFKKSAIEDIVIARFLKKEGIQTACITGESRVKCRMYESYGQALDGFTKNVFMFFGNLPILGFLFGVLSIAGFVPVIVFDQAFICLYLCILLHNQFLISLITKQDKMVSILLLPVQLIFLFRVMVKALFIKKNSSYLWKGRGIY
jgi:glycosyltransferase involved in cell wall biosynthesis